MKALLLLPLICVLNFSCTTPGNMSAINIQNVKFVISPYVLNKNGEYFLVYQIAIDKKGSNVRHQIGEKIINNKFYYFFTGKSSFPEYDHPVYRPVKKEENIMRLFKSDSVFWLNPDKSELKLKIVYQ